MCTDTAQLPASSLCALRETRINRGTALKESERDEEGNEREKVFGVSLVSAWVKRLFSRMM